MQFMHAETVIQHMGMIRAVLRLLMQSCRNNRGLGTDGLMMVGFQNKSIVIDWVPSHGVPDTDPLIKAMAHKCRAGDVSKMCVVIMHPDGGRSGYLITPMVNMAETPNRYAILGEAHYPPPPKPDPDTLQRHEEMVLSDILDTFKNL